MNRIFSTKQTKQVASLRHLLEIKAKQGSQSFAQTVQNIDWALQTPELFLHAIDLALALGMSTVATQLAREGFRRYPNHARLQSAHMVLTPVKAHALPETGDASIANSMREINLQMEKYRGQWVALKEGEVMAAAATLKALHSQLQSDDRSILITKVL